MVLLYRHILVCIKHLHNLYSTSNIYWRKLEVEDRLSRNLRWKWGECFQIFIWTPYKGIMDTLFFFSLFLFSMKGKLQNYINAFSRNFFLITPHNFLFLLFLLPLFSSLFLYVWFCACVCVCQVSRGLSLLPVGFSSHYHEWLAAVFLLLLRFPTHWH